MTFTNATNFRKNLFDYLGRAVQFNEVVVVNGKHGNAVLLSEADYNSMMETLYLMSVPGLAESIKASAAEPLAQCAVYDPEEQW